MQVTVTFRRIEPTPALRRHAEDKVRRACKVLRRPIEAHLVLSVFKRHHVAEVTVTANQLVLNATAETHDLYAAIDEAVSKLERQIKRHLKKRQTRKHAGAIPAAAPPLDGGAERRAIATQRVAIKPMSVREAVMQLEATRSECLLFHNAASDTVAVLYRRRNGGYGLIEPEVA